ncbi:MULTISPECIES: copper chaperone PCu(A)C [unclassified Pseudomonas]|uniref:copper chaperone PCu(A)C n=1 Tax=unclassified Pseudomonas TaxID=196821 RepID=UPI002AC8F4C4|nr:MULTISPECIES: copper chaperone PCu(A)C [unclassified Pseudomonas]MEB0048507.1 copper chaperone PCu(A)C [Pseudomonas sp. Dout3]MEB0099370.1 copper chaperone PCu(A)C [Pseudomonas sp. DC1.2]WPX61184.1 copper chaperone PCu(A)C [Pseudomonas sp. DC1.2]
MNSTLNRTAITQRIKHAAFGFSLLTLAFQVCAQTQVDDAWVRATVPGQQATGAFMTVTASSDSKLLSVQSPVAKIVQIHQSTLKNDVMSMQPAESVALPAGKAVTLDPHGYHVMLIDLITQVKEGDKVPLVLTVENAKGEKESINVEAQARALNMPDHSAMKMN